MLFDIKTINQSIKQINKQASKKEREKARRKERKQERKKESKKESKNLHVSQKCWAGGLRNTLHPLTNKPPNWAGESSPFHVSEVDSCFVSVLYSLSF